MSWSAPLDKTFITSTGKSIRTLADARDFLLKLPKSRFHDADVHAAIEALIMAADGRGPILHATAGMGLVINGRSGIQLPKSTPKSIWRPR